MPDPIPKWCGRSVKMDGCMVLVSRDGVPDDFDTGRDDPGAAFAFANAPPLGVLEPIQALQVLSGDVLMIRTSGGLYAVTQEPGQPPKMEKVIA